MTQHLRLGAAAAIFLALAAPAFAQTAMTDQHPAPGPGDAAAPQRSPYAGQEKREIKALSPEDMAGLMGGRGLGLAKAAELNGYPGPLHVLDFAVPMSLTPEQLQAITAIYEKMSSASKPVGAEIVARERELDRRLRKGDIGEAELGAQVGAIAELQGRLRTIHLAAHLATKAALTPEQVARYNELRGYGGAAASATAPSR